MLEPSNSTSHARSQKIRVTSNSLPSGKRLFRSGVRHVKDDKNILKELKMEVWNDCYKGPESGPRSRTYSKFNITYIEKDDCPVVTGTKNAI